MLLVEDDPASRDAVVAMLEELGITEVETANDGEQALQALERRKFGTLLLDLMLPKVDGYEILRALRNGTHQRPKRVIVMSAQTQTTDLSSLIALGADAFIPKPFTLAELEQALA